MIEGKWKWRLSGRPSWNSSVFDSDNMIISERALTGFYIEDSILPPSHNNSVYAIPASLIDRNLNPVAEYDYLWIWRLHRLTFFNACTRV